MPALRGFYHSYSIGIYYITFFSFLVFFALLWVKKDWLLRQRISLNLPFFILAVCLGLSWLVWVGLYLIFPSYFDHIEAGTVSISLANFNGQPLYPHGPQEPYLYGLLYGPFDFWIAGLLPYLATVSGIVHPTSALFMPLTKLTGVVVCLLGIYAFYASLKKINIGFAERIICLVLLVLTVMPFEEMVFSDRGDSSIFALASLGLWVALRGPSRANWLAIGLVAGAAGDFKIHAFIYLVPAVGIMLAYPSTHARRFGDVVLAGAVCAAVMILPLACDGRMGRNYLFFMHLAAQQPLAWLEFSQSAAFALSLIFYVALGYVAARTRPDRASWVHIGSLLLAILVTMLPASKVGAGPHHLSPYIFYAVFEIARALGRRERGEAGSVGQLNTPILAMTLYLGLIFSPILLHDLRLSIINFKTESRNRQEIVALAVKYPAAQLAPGADDGYGSSFFNPIIVARTKQLTIETAAYMDMKLEHLPEAPLTAAIASCRVPQWIVASGAPWSMTSFYDGKPLFSETLQKSFLSSYRQIEQGTAYSVWQCKG